MRVEVTSEKGMLSLIAGQEVTVTSPVGHDVKVFFFGSGTWVGTKHGDLTVTGGKVIAKNGSGITLYKPNSFVEMRQKESFLIIKNVALR